MKYLFSELFTLIMSDICHNNLVFNIKEIMVFKIRRYKNISLFCYSFWKGESCQIHRRGQLFEQVYSKE